MTYERVDGVNDAGEQEVTLMNGTKRIAVIARGDGESDEAFEARIVETDAIIAERNQ